MRLYSDGHWVTINGDHIRSPNRYEEYKIPSESRVSYSYRREEESLDIEEFEEDGPCIEPDDEGPTDEDGLCVEPDSEGPTISSTWMNTYRAERDT